jgi:hypothetical protein
MEQIKITINTGNSAFEGGEGYELARILRGLADKLENGSEPSKLMDINGNSVGTIEYK